MNNKLNTVMNVFKSLVKLNNYNVKRFDIQAFDYGHGIEGYCGYLYTDDITIIIRGDGSFEIKD